MYRMATLFVIVLLSTTVKAIPLLNLDVQAHIDGRDQLIIRDDTLQWHHFDFAAVGRHVGANSPTIINGISGAGFEWIPEWPLPPPDEIRFEAFSSVLAGIIDPLPADGSLWQIDKLFGRGSASIVEQPTSSNGFGLVVEFNDNPQGGSTFYGIQLSRGPVGVPEPGMLALLSIGLIGIGAAQALKKH